jgi:NNP family nitrate/nitrite transporter-like MFS transporter
MRYSFFGRAQSCSGVSDRKFYLEQSLATQSCFYKRKCKPWMVLLTLNTTSSYRWVILGVVWIIAFTCALTTFVCPPHIDEMIHTFRISIPEAAMFMSLINLSAFSFNFVGGIVSAKTGARQLMGAGLAIIAGAQIISGLTGSYIIELAARFVLGMGIGLTMICVMKSVAEWFSLRELALAFSIQATGWATGNAVGLAAAIPLSKVLGVGWEGTFLAVGAFTVVVNVAFWVLFREATPIQERTSSEVQELKIGGLLKMKDFWIVCIGLIGQIVGMSIAMTWLPLSLTEADWTASEAAFLTTLFPIMGIPANLVGGAIANKLGRKKPLFMVSGAFLMIAYVLFAVTTQGALIWVATILAGWFNFFFVGPLLAIPAELPDVGPRRSGIFLGLMNLLSGVGGFLAPLAVGLLRESTGSFAAGFIFAALTSALLLIPGFIAKETSGIRAKQV